MYKVYGSLDLENFRKSFLGEICYFHYDPEV